MPIQEKLSTNAIHLSEQWKQALELHQSSPDTEKFKTLLIDTLQYLDKFLNKLTQRMRNC